jgi:hypothetical protein
MKTARRCVLFVGLLLAAVTVPQAQQATPQTPPEESVADHKLIRVQVEFIDVAHQQLTELMFGDHTSTNDIKMPMFYTLRTNTSVFAVPGQQLLVAALSPKGPDGNTDFTRKGGSGLGPPTCPPDGGENEGSLRRRMTSTFPFSLHDHLRPQGQSGPARRSSPTGRA